ncbi:MAG TPA: thiamine phosphate synthase [Gammaproteobacteria bacterium]|nr:thiamine phosphate synthase [Gammaproteobacteria bacterium]
MMKNNKFSIGLYPVVDSVEWIATLLPLGITHIQLRIKHKSGQALENEIKQSIELARKYQACLYINDYWELAIRHGAEAVHLGQDALDKANISAIHSAGLRLGISTHDEMELSRALACEPTYLAFGSIFPTTSKVMTFPPQGVEKLVEWRKKIHCPLVAIGGINSSNIESVLSTNIDGVALISAITKAPEPIFATQLLLERINNYGA